MQLIKQSSRPRPRVSLILLDWSVRESFHLLHYLSKQDVDRDLFEVIIIEYYSRISDAIRHFEDQADSWLLLEMPEDCYYHKHLMYNAGIVAAKGDICVICDSDAMVKPGFIRSIITAFENLPNTVLHIDQFRNARKDLYPFAYPDFSEVTGRGCINNVGGKTRGVVDDKDPVHNRNYGACMCARRDDLISIGGADEHIDYLGHICGPYEMTFRLVNFGRREIWHQTEFMYHTWHPGQAGTNNYLGRHDGRHVSTAALDALINGRIPPVVENGTIRELRLSSRCEVNLESFQICPDYLRQWNVENHPSCAQQDDQQNSRSSWSGFVIERRDDGFRAYPKLAENQLFSQMRNRTEHCADTIKELRRRLFQTLPLSIRLAFPVIVLLTYLSRGFGLGYLYAQKRFYALAKVPAK